MPKLFTRIMAVLLVHCLVANSGFAVSALTLPQRLSNRHMPFEDQALTLRLCNFWNETAASAPHLEFGILQRFWDLLPKYHPATVGMGFGSLGDGKDNDFDAELLRRQHRRAIRQYLEKFDPTFQAQPVSDTQIQALMDLPVAKGDLVWKILEERVKRMRAGTIAAELNKIAARFQPGTAHTPSAPLVAPSPKPSRQNLLEDSRDRLEREARRLLEQKAGLLPEETVQTFNQLLVEDPVYLNLVHAELGVSTLAKLRDQLIPFYGNPRATAASEYPMARRAFFLDMAQIVVKYCQADRQAHRPGNFLYSETAAAVFDLLGAPRGPFMNGILKTMGADARRMTQPYILKINSDYRGIYSSMRQLICDWEDGRSPYEIAIETSVSQEDNPIVADDFQNRDYLYRHVSPRYIPRPYLSREEFFEHNGQRIPVQIALSKWLAGYHPLRLMFDGKTTAWVDDYIEGSRKMFSPAQGEAIFRQVAHILGVYALNDRHAAIKAVEQGQSDFAYKELPDGRLDLQLTTVRLLEPATHEETAIAETLVECLFQEVAIDGTETAEHRYLPEALLPSLEGFYAGLLERWPAAPIKDRTPQQAMASACATIARNIAEEPDSAESADLQMAIPQLTYYADPSHWNEQGPKPLESSVLAGLSKSFASFKIRKPADAEHPEDPLAISGLSLWIARQSLPPEASFEQMFQRAFRWAPWIETLVFIGLPAALILGLHVGFFVAGALLLMSWKGFAPMHSDGVWRRVPQEQLQKEPAALQEADQVIDGRHYRYDSFQANPLARAQAWKELDALAVNFHGRAYALLFCLSFKSSMVLIPHALAINIGVAALGLGAIYRHLKHNRKTDGILAMTGSAAAPALARIPKSSDPQELSGPVVEQITQWVDHMVVIVGYMFGLPAELTQRVRSQIITRVFASAAQSSAGAGALYLCLSESIDTSGKMWGLLKNIASEVGHAFHQILIEGHPETAAIMAEGTKEMFDIAAWLGLVAAVDFKLLDNARKYLKPERGRDILAALKRLKKRPEQFEGGAGKLSQQVLRQIIPSINSKHAKKYIAMRLRHIANDFFKVVPYEPTPLPYAAHHFIADHIMDNFIQTLCDNDPALAVRIVGQTLLGNPHHFKSVGHFSAHLRHLSQRFSRQQAPEKTAVVELAIAAIRQTLHSIAENPLEIPHYENSSHDAQKKAAETELIDHLVNQVVADYFSVQAPKKAAIKRPSPSLVRAT